MTECDVYACAETPEYVLELQSSLGVESFPMCEKHRQEIHRGIENGSSITLISESSLDIVEPS